MGGGPGGRISPLLSSADEDSLLDQEIQDHPFESSALLREDGSSSKVDDGDDDSLNPQNGLMLEKFDDMVGQSTRDSLYFKAKRARSVYNAVLTSYDDLHFRTKRLEDAKLKILRYKPGTWTEKVGGMKLRDYIVPKTTTLLLVGPERSGKSSLVNRISRVFDDDEFSSERAQVSYNCNDGDGTYFLQEIMVPRGSSSFCLYDTRSLSDNESENTKHISQWMTEGVRHGELVIRKSDSPNLRNKLKCKSHQNLHISSKKRVVNFVIFVVSGLSVLNSMDSGDKGDARYNKMIATMFSCPFLSFKDDKPVVVVTHGDLLSVSDRARVRVYLGELLGIPPNKQIFDIPDDSEPGTDLTIIDLLRYSLVHADNNLPTKRCFMSKICLMRQPGSLILVLILGIATISALVHNAYVYNGNRLNIPRPDAPISKKTNDTSRANNTSGIHKVCAPKADALHVSQTDTPTGRNTNDSSDIHKVRARKADALHISQTYTPTGRNTNDSSDIHKVRAPKADTLHISRTDNPGSNTNNPSDIHKVRAPKADALHVSQTDTPTGSNTNTHPRVERRSRIRTRHARKTDASHLLQKATTEDPSPIDWSKMRGMYFGPEYV